ncbi:MAG: mechanosensitive ion channel family protein, partial [Bauldia litoralis]
RLDAVAAANATKASDSIFVRIQRDVGRLKVRLPVMIQGLGAVPTVFATNIEKLAGDRGTIDLTGLILHALAAFLIGFLAELAVRPLFRNIRRRINATPVDAPRALRLWRSIQRALIALLFIAIFGVVSAAAFLLFFSDVPLARMLFGTYFGFIVVVRLIALVTRFVFAPSAPALRLENVSDTAAQEIYRMVLWVSVPTAFGMATARLFQRWGLGEAPSSLILVIFGAIATIVVSSYLWRWRRGVGEAIRASAAANTGAYAFIKTQFSGFWHFAVMVYIWIVFVLWCFQLLAFGVFSVAGTVSLLLVLPAFLLLDRMAKRLLVYRHRTATSRDLEFEAHAPEEDLLATESGEAEPLENPGTAAIAEPPPEVVSRNRYGRVVHRIVRILLLLVAALVVLGALGVDPFASLENSVGTQIAAGVVDTVIVVLAGYILYELTIAWFDKRMAEEIADAPRQDQAEAGEGGGSPRSRLATLLPIFRAFLIIVLLTITVMIILSNLGVNIGPLLAGAGILGVAIGFGSQTLVRDIVSGAFFLIDDAFRVGEYVETGPVKGTVEKIAIRSLRLRHHRGLVHTIPYGEIKSVTNFSRDWVIMKLEFRLPYGTDIEKVRKLIKKVGLEMDADENLAKGMLAPLKSQGVTRMEDSALIFRAKFTAKPGEQFVLRREAYSRIQATLLQNGIGFAPARVQVEFTDSGQQKSGDDREKIAAGAAGHLAAQPPEPKPA